MGKQYWVAPMIYPWASLQIPGATVSDSSMREEGCVGFLAVFESRREVKDFLDGSKYPDTEPFAIGSDSPAQATVGKERGEK